MPLPSPTLSQTRPLALTCSALLLLSGCATNPLRLEYAENVATLGQSAATASSQFLAKVEEDRIESNLTLIERDPNCVPRTAYVRLQPDLSSANANGGLKRGWLCAAAPNDGPTAAISLAPLGQELQPTLTLISALGAYSQSISEILDDDGVDLASEFNDTIALLRAAEGTICALNGGTVADDAGDGDAICKSASGSGPAIPNSSDGRLGAIGDFLGFVTELANEEQKVQQLRKLANSEEGSIELILALRTHLRTWNNSRNSAYALRAIIEESIMGQTFRASKPPSPSARRKLAEQYYDFDQGHWKAKKAYAALDSTLNELAVADRDLRRVLKQNPNLTEKEKAKVARTFRSRVTRALNSLTGLLTAF